MWWSLVLAVCVMHTHRLACLDFQAPKQSPDLVEIVTRLERPGKRGLARKLSSDDVLSIDLSETASRIRDVAAADPSSVCVDKISGCSKLGEFYGYSVCHAYVPWARNYCPRYCGLCQGPSDTEASTGLPPRHSNTTPAAAENGASGPCEDKEKDCMVLGYSICTAYVDWARLYCARYCGLCDAEATTQEVQGGTTPTTSCCVDQIGWEKCITHKEDSCEGIYIPWAQANCQAFCGFCQPCPIEPCEDTIPYCEQYGAESCIEENYRMWAVTNCRKTCNRCYNYGYHNKWNPNVTIPTPTGLCVDKIDHCEEFGMKDCAVYGDFMSKYCPHYCGFCTPDSAVSTAVSTTSEQGDVPTPGPTQCQDKLHNCTHYLEENCCSIYEPWARDNCASYCGFCGVPPPRNCTDNVNYCDREPDDLCTNPNYRLFRMENCAGFCRLCDKPWVPPSCAAYLYPEKTSPALSTDGSSSPTVIPE